MDHYIRKYACAKCESERIPTAFDSVEDLQEHFLYCTSDEVKECPFCKQFIPNDLVREHIAYQHPDDKDTSVDDVSEESFSFKMEERKPAHQSTITSEMSVITSARPSIFQTSVKETKKITPPLSNVFNLPQEDEVVRNITPNSDEIRPPVHKDSIESIFDGGASFGGAKEWYSSKTHQPPIIKSSFTVAGEKSGMKSSFVDLTREDEGVSGINTMRYKQCPPSTATSEDELDEIRQRIKEREKIDNKTVQDHVGHKLNKNQQEGVQFEDTMLQGQILKNSVQCNGREVSMGTAIMKCVIESKKVDLTKQMKGVKVKAWNKERVREHMTDCGLNAINLTNGRTFGTNVEKVMKEAEYYWKVMKPLGRTGGGELGDIENNEFLTPDRAEGNRALNKEQKLWAELWEENLELTRQLTRKVTNKKVPEEKYKSTFMDKLLRPNFGDPGDVDDFALNDEEKERKAQKRSVDQRRMSSDKMRRKEAVDATPSTSESELDPNDQFKKTVGRANHILDGLLPQPQPGSSNNSDLENRVKQNEKELIKMKEEVRSVKVEVVKIKEEVSEVRKDVVEVKKKIVEGNEKLDKILMKLNL